VRSDVNLGFAKACNLGLRLAQTDAVLFLNNDIEMTAPNWLDGIRAALEPGVLVGARLRNDPHAWVEGTALPYLDGWCLAGMRDDLLELGGFDEDFDEPSYYGDNDLCLRARAAGMRLREVRVGLRHLENVTAGHGDAVTAATRANYERYAARARELLGVAA
jgi:GT2 family glycosyltransferase